MQAKHIFMFFYFDNCTKWYGNFDYDHLHQTKTFSIITSHAILYSIVNIVVFSAS